VPDVDTLSVTFAALADPTRRAVLARLRKGEATVTQLAEPFDMSLPAVSRHLKVLERAGLVSKGRDAQWRPCRLDAAPLREVDEWVKGYRAFFEDRYDRLAAQLAGDGAEHAGDHAEHHADHHAEHTEEP
jgi:DNA-binding transcriptional ArsR family regulator